MAKGVGNRVERFIPDMDKLAVTASPNMHASNGSSSVDPRNLNYEGTDLNEITRRQLMEDINAYRYDLEFCKQQLAVPDLTPQETRTFQLRILDLGHQIRHASHRIEMMQIQARPAAAAAITNGNHIQRPSSQSTNGTTATKRPRLSVRQDSEEDDESMDGIAMSTSVQRLGFWKCHLCTSTKYLEAGPNRVPSAPCKWPLKDVSKMLNHFLDMHTEHTPTERCLELGAALAQNRGPFEYWLTRTKTQKLGDGAIIDDCIETLLAGGLPDVLRNLNKAAAAFPNISNGHKP